MAQQAHRGLRSSPQDSSGHERTHAVCAREPGICVSPGYELLSPLPPGVSGWAGTAIAILWQTLYGFRAAHSLRKTKQGPPKSQNTKHLLLHFCSECSWCQNYRYRTCLPGAGDHTPPMSRSVTYPPLPVLTLPSFGLTDENMHLWCPSLQEVKEVFRSLGAYNPALYPQGPYQHSSRCVPFSSLLPSL